MENDKINAADSRAVAEEIVRVLDAKKGYDIRLLRVEDHTVIADYFVICGGTSNTNVKALAGEVEYKLGLHGVTPLRMDGYNEGKWVVVDFGSVLVHIMTRETRDFYKLEKRWQDAEAVDISSLLTRN